MENNRTCLPPFSYDIHTWVTHVQACLTDPVTVNTDQQKYLAVVKALLTEVAALIMNTIVNPPEENKFTAITSALSTKYHYNYYILYQPRPFTIVLSEGAG
ncbi:hypothetical protein Pmani_020743 [Petrolisthes manimaculis]|uniref:Uncharacterized protein n=1 Tax=Petrolisthes manimaculis TaxID=1843537 RepID=A0AAE1U3Z2_9EUCA|nr:hypothetical protein Pmani_020743 [Petrolisthes manimaculis]